MPFIEDNDVRAFIGAIVFVSSLFTGVGCIVCCILKRDEHQKRRHVIVMQTPPNYSS
jgi:hypothetical protein|tara:strand:+ start:1228 stop:1398 length:171 start_codon:yes stop_codon:yes gene_type:complete